MNTAFQTVIRTKIHPPVNRTFLVKRERIIDQLASDTLAKLTLVAAPAGFGKTTLITQLFEKMTAKSLCCWYSLDQSDSDPSRFLHHLIAAIRTVHDGFGDRILQLIETTLISDIADTLAHLVNDLLDIDKELVLFIDDYHFSESEQINQFVELLINLSPDNFHLVISSRMRPNLSLSGLKVYGYLNEITANHLRFDDDEAEIFMNEIHELKLSRQQLTDLYEHSEGWVAGLQLASLSLRDIERRDEFIDSFSGNLRDIAEYLAADVLNQQPAEIRDFLLRTAILDRMDSEVCFALTGIKDCQVYLDRLEEQNLFVIPLDEERKWFRYHHLFHEFLQGQLKKRYPSDVVKLYQKAADWFETQGSASEAVDYALLSGDMQKAVMLVELQVEDEMKAGRMPRVNNWVDRIPDEECLSHPKLLFAKATALYHMNKPEEAERTLERIRACTTIDDEQREEYVNRLQAGVAICRDDVDSILPPLSAIDMGPSNFDNGTVCNTRGYALASISRFDEAIDSLKDARYYHKLNGSTFGVVYADCFLGLVDIARGNPKKSYERFSIYANNSGKTIDTYVAPVPPVMQGIVLYEWNKIDEAASLLVPNLPVLEKVGHIKLLTLGCITLARIHGINDDHAGAMRFFDRLYNHNTYRGTSFLRLQSLLESERIRYLICANRVNEAIDIASSIGIDIEELKSALPDHWERISCLNLLSWARLQIAIGAAERCLDALERLVLLAARVGRTKMVIQGKILLAKALATTGAIEQSGRVLMEALHQSYASTLIRTYLDEDVTGLLRNLQADPTTTTGPAVRTYLEQLMLACESGNARAESPRPDAAMSALVDPLNGRELDILRLIAIGQSNHIIAERLSISENTVKWHVKNIFSKLGVNKRTAAVVAAQHLKLLSPP